MKYTKSTLTIGIPAYNEEANIGLLLNDITLQKNRNYILKEIIVVSDGSTDSTVKKVEQASIQSIKLIINKKRTGLANVQNQINLATNSEILLLLQADLRIHQKNFIEKIISPVIDGTADLVVPSVIEVEPVSLLGKVLHLSTKIKNSAFEKYRSGDNVYTCRGLARAFSRRLFKSISYKKSIGEDAYSYLFCKHNKFTYQFLRDISITFRLPETFEDHKKQSLRFFQAKRYMINEFGQSEMQNAFYIPLSVLLKSALKPVLSQPIYSLLYVILFSYLKLKSIFVNNINDIWDIATSSKNI